MHACEGKAYKQNMESELRITKVTTYSAKVVQLRPKVAKGKPVAKVISSTPVRRALVYHDISESTIDNSRLSSMPSLITGSIDSLVNLDQLLDEDTDPSRSRQRINFIEPIDEKCFECAICGLEFYHKMSRDAHLLSHTGTLPRRSKRKSKTPMGKLAKIARFEEKTSTSSPMITPFKKSFKKLRASLRRKKTTL